MKTLILGIICVSLIPSAQSQENTPTNFPVSSPFSTSVDGLQDQQRNISMTDESGNATYKSQQDLNRELDDGVRLYKAKKYAEAYAFISVLAQWGIKDAQAILGGMYLVGEHVDKSTERGLLWLGVAKEESTQRNAAKSFDYVYEQLSQEHKTYIDQKVAEHIQKFGSEAQHINCRQVSQVGSNIKATQCSKVTDSNSVLHAIE